jgi:hypothetical protein
MNLTIPNRLVNKEFIKHQEYDIELAHVGQGNWRAFRAIGIDLHEVMDIARSWSGEIGAIHRPWLCWNVDDDWCFVQQRLVQYVGWTPLVGFDPRTGPPKNILPGSVVFDFNQRLRLPILYPHFPLEFMFLFCDKIAFWHSDLLVRPEKMRRLAAMFNELLDGQTAATWVSPGFRQLFSHKQKRYWELVGCTTRAASRDQFDKGCGWWMEHWAHQNQRNGDEIVRKYYWDHGAGIYYWHKRERGRIVKIDGRDYSEGHFTKIGNKNYERFREDGWSDARRLMSSEIKQHWDLRHACSLLGLEHI